MIQQVHKTDPILALIFSPQEVQANAHRCLEWLQTLQHPQFQSLLAEEGVLNVSSGQHGNNLVILITFKDLDAIREFMLNRREYTVEGFQELCRELGKDPQPYLEAAPVQGFHMAWG